MKKSQQHINRIISIALLWVFAIALTPFGALHHHDEAPQCLKNEKTCTHKLHVSNHTETCLVCAAHFEKNYLHEYTHFQVFLEIRTLSKYYALVSGSYTELIGSSLRGPPVA
ncbi:hypothetical protein DBR43_14535 [Pedobacter sp. KBW06]|uniref:hypothetical protein n=1 Tax=Pedobacter sp. KBW06 TaxID=2153359 RepID=UPI000F5A93BF|nr:hypothetical protein [Pedobacter sp. KBW06]RQO72410.1 hypothetical protein DBR43_14535 [Pedobacter sp. KBW06]